MNTKLKSTIKTLRDISRRKELSDKTKFDLLLAINSLEAYAQDNKAMYQAYYKSTLKKQP